MRKKQDPPKAIKLLMLHTDTSITDLMKHFDTSQPAISNAISGRRPELQKKILSYLKSL